MKKNMQILLLVLFVFTVAACIPVPVVVGPSSAGYEDQYGYDDEYVDVPIAYGEPYYFAPPIVVTYPYDYFTYEMVGGFVDIIFWRGGHRYRHERWNDNGRRISSADMRSRQWHQRIRGSELNQHREKLRQNHNISHPDSYYGLKSRPQQQMQQRPQQTEQKPQWGQQQRPQQTEQKPQRGQQPPQQAGQRPQLEQQQPQQAGQRPQFGQQPQQGNLRQTPQQTRQQYQQEQQKLQQERQKKINERFKKPEQEQEQEPKQGQEEMTKRPPR